MIDFKKSQGLVPAIIQHQHNQKVLMLGYMNQEALTKTLDTGRVTFYSRSKKRLWTKGESSGHYLLFQSYTIDCDKDSLLVQALPQGPTCHQGTESCFGSAGTQGFLYELQEVIGTRMNSGVDASYTASLLKKGINKVAQKVGEEAVEVVIEATNGSIDLLKEEAADLMFHILVLLKAKDLSLADVEGVLKKRHVSSLS